MSEPTQWFVVWNERRGAPTVKHADRPAAVAEAKRLALLHPGETFHVLAVVASAKRSEPVILTTYSDVADLEDGTPF